MKTSNEKGRQEEKQRDLEKEGQSNRGGDGH